jgi:thioredoxin-like negative regulator of GroEL
MSSGYRLKCSGCGHEERVLDPRLKKHPKCGNCSTVLISSNCLVVTVDETNWKEEVLNSSGAVLVWFWGPECDLCESYRLSVRKMSADFCGLSRIVSVNIEEIPKLAEELGIFGVPVWLLYINGKRIKRLDGPRGAKGLYEVVERELESN